MADWSSDSSIISGLTDVGYHSAPNIFMDGSTRKLISGERYGNFVGWYWSGSSWVSDSSIVSGLTDVGWSSTPTVFNDSGTLKLISGNSAGNFYGWYWSGSSWVSDSSIVSGLTGVGSYSTPTVFNDSGTLKLISGSYYGIFYGWYWSGSSWVSDSSIVSGLTGVGTDSYCTPTVFNDGSDLKLISGDDNSATFWGWYWGGSSWVYDSSIVSGLTSIIGYQYTPNVFIDGSDLKLISGEFYGIFYGWTKELPGTQVGDTVLLIPNYADKYDRAAIKGGAISTGDNVQLYPLKGGAKVAIKEEWTSGDKIIF